MIPKNKINEIQEKHFIFCSKFLLINIYECIDQIEDYNNKQLLTNFFQKKFKPLVCDFFYDSSLNHELEELANGVEGTYKFITMRGRNAKEQSPGTFSQVLTMCFKNNYKLFGEKDNSTKYTSSTYGDFFWNSYEYINVLDIIVCPYCNSEFIFTQLEDKNEEGLPRITIRPQLDHFYSQKEFSYLASTIFNLVPSCKTCNSSIKHDIEVNGNDHMNPLINNPYDYLKFTRAYDFYKDHYLELIGRTNQFSLKFEKLNLDIDEIDYSKAISTMDFFRIIDRYEPFKNYIQKQISKELLYGKLYSENLENAYPKLFSPGEVRMITDQEKAIDQKHIFSKVISDLLDKNT